MGWGELTRFFISSGPGADRSRLGLPLLAGLEFTDDLVHDPVRLGLLRRHEEVPVRVLLDLGQRLPRVLHENVVQRRDRKSTRLNSSHITISYAVFCLKKKISQHLI